MRRRRSESTISTRAFEDLSQVVAHYAQVLKPSLSESEKADLIQFLKSL